MATGQGQYTTPLVILSFVPVDSLPLPEAHFLSTDLDLYVGWVTVCLKKKSMKYGGSWSWTEGGRADAAIARRWCRGKLPNCDRISMTVHMGVCPCGGAEVSRSPVYAPGL